MIAIIDYGVGNLFSLTCSLKKIGAECAVTSDKSTLRSASGLILPGVGAFGDAAEKLGESGLDNVIKELVYRGKPLLGILSQKTGEKQNVSVPERPKTVVGRYVE